MLAISDDNEDVQEELLDKEEDAVVLYTDEDENLSCVLQKILLNPKTKYHPQRHPFQK